MHELDIKDGTYRKILSHPALLRKVPVLPSLRKSGALAPVGHLTETLAWLLNWVLGNSVKHFI